MDIVRDIFQKNADTYNTANEQKSFILFIHKRNAGKPQCVSSYQLENGHTKTRDTFARDKSGNEYPCRLTWCK